MDQPKKCPICKRGALKKFDSSPTLTTLTCSNCSRLIQIKTSAGKVIEVLVPGLGLFASVVTILGFLEIENMEKLSELLDKLEDL